MNNRKDSGAFLLITGISILSIFIYISVENIIPNNSSNSYYSKNEEGPTALINNIVLIDGKLKIDINEDNVFVCAKSTKTTPNKNSICWKKTNNKKVEFSVYEGKTYYIWLKDNNEKISEYTEYNTNKKK